MQLLTITSVVRRYLLGYVLFVILCVAASDMARADWPQFRGPAGDGHAESGSVPLRWSPDDQIAWQQALPGEGWSSPVVADRRVFVSSAVPSQGVEGDYSLRLYRLDLSTGEILSYTELFVQHESESPAIHNKNSHASPTPLVDGDRVFVHFGHQGTACVDLDGNVIWRNDSLRYEPVHGNGGSPVLVDGVLVFSCDAREHPFVVGLDATTGQVKWRTPRETNAVKKFSFSTPTVVTVDGQRQVISPGSNAVCAYDPQTGAEIWRVSYDGYSVTPKPVVGNGMVYLSTSFDSPQVLAIRLGGAQGDSTHTHVAWTLDRGGPKTPSLILRDQLLFMVSDDGVASCVEAVTGELLWRKRLGGDFSASPVLVGDRIYFFNESGRAYVVRAGAEFELLAESDLGQRTLASPAVIDNALLVRTADALYRIE